MHRCSAVKDSGLDIWKVLAEPSIFVLDLIGELACVTHDKSGALAGHWLNLLKCRKDEDCSLSKPGLCLAEDIGSKDGLRNAHLLDCDEAMPMLDLLSRNDISKCPVHFNVRPSRIYMILQEVRLFCQRQASMPTLKGTSFLACSTHLAGGLGSLLVIRCSRTPIIVNVTSEDDSSNEIHLKRLRSVIATCSRNTV